MVEQIDAKCSLCGEGCYGDVINTYGKYYHQFCFSCVVPGCTQELTHGGFFYIEGELYCRDDYHRLMGTQCASCRKYIEGEAISVFQSQYHPTCFGCESCGKVFPIGCEICYDGEDFFCQDCNVSPKVKTSPSVAKAEDVVPASDPLDIKGREDSENENIDDSDDMSDKNIDEKNDKNIYYEKNDKNIGEKNDKNIDEKNDKNIIDEKNDKNVEKNNGDILNSHEYNICAGCENHIKSGQALLALDKQWHLWCFTCFKCGALLTGEYMGRDGVPYCEKDYQADFGISCAGCGDFITGKVLQAGEKHYHPSCSRCAKCGEMFGEGEDMYLQGSEIWHPHCSEEVVSSDHDEQDGNKSEESEPGIPHRKSEALISEDIPASPPSYEESFANKSPPNPATSPGVWKPPSTMSPPPYTKPPGFRSVKPPGFRSVKPPVTTENKKTSEDECDDAPPIPPPPTRSSSNMWRQKYSSGVYAATPFQKHPENIRPKSYCESMNRNVNDQEEEPLEKFLSRSHHSLGSSSEGNDSDGEDVDGCGRRRTISQISQKGIGYNQLKHRKTLKDQARHIKLPTNIDPERLRQFLDDPNHNVYLDDREFHQIFKMTREKFYGLPQSKKEELKNSLIFF